MRGYARRCYCRRSTPGPHSGRLRACVRCRRQPQWRETRGGVGLAVPSRRRESRATQRRHDLTDGPWVGLDWIGLVISASLTSSPCSSSKAVRPSCHAAATRWTTRHSSRRVRAHRCKTCPSLRYACPPSRSAPANGLRPRFGWYTCWRAGGSAVQVQRQSDRG